MSDGSNPHDVNELQDSASEDKQGAGGMSGSQVYNVVTDTVTGVNIRPKDNIFQAVFIAVCLVLGAVIGALLVQEHLVGALVGAVIGLLVGLFGSGIFLMIFRAVMHIRGRHD